MKTSLFHWGLGLALLLIAVYVGGSLIFLQTQASTGEVVVENIGPTFVGSPEISTTIGGSEAYTSGTISNVIAGSTRDVFVKGQVQDLNGASDINFVKVKFYRNDATCNTILNRDGNTCYYRDKLTDPSRCSYSYLNEVTVQYTCKLTLFSWIDATDTTAGTDQDYYWVVDVYVEDDQGESDQDNSRSVEIASVTGLDIPPGIDFGTMAVDSQTSDPISQEITQQGNVIQDVTVLSGAEFFACSGSDIGIPIENLHWSTSQVGWGVEGDTTITGDAYDTNLAVQKRVHEFIAPTKNLYWNLKIPDGVDGTCSATINVSAKNANI